MPTSSLESCTSLHLVFKVRLWLATTYWSEEKIKRSLTFHCSGFLIIWTPLILASICRARLCNAATVQEEPGTREMLDLEHPWCTKKSRRGARRTASLGAHNSITHISVVFGESVSVGKVFACHQNGHAEWSNKLGSELTHINICCHWGCKTKADRSFQDLASLSPPTTAYKVVEKNTTESWGGNEEKWSRCRNTEWQSSPRMGFYGNGKIVLRLSQALTSGPTQLRPKEVQIKEVSFVVCHILCDYGHSKSSF